MKIETHVHTRYSKDSLQCFWPLYLKCRCLGISYIAITEHNNIDGGLTFQSFCKKRGSKVQVIVGEEVFTSEGEIIGLYLTKNIPAGLSPEETITEIHRQGGIVYVPHPYDEKREKTVLKEEAIARNKERIDCIEVYNGRNVSSRFTKKQEEIARRYSIQPVIGSDAHTWMEIGRNYMICSNRDLSTAKSFRQTVVDLQFHTKPCLKIAHQITKFAKVCKLVKNGDFHEIYRRIVKKIKKDQS